MAINKNNAKYSYLKFNYAHFVHIEEMGSRWQFFGILSSCNCNFNGFWPKFGRHAFTPLHKTSAHIYWSNGYTRVHSLITVSIGQQKQYIGKDELGRDSTVPCKIVSHIDGKICNRTQQKRMLYLALLIRHKETVDYFICRKTHSCCSVERSSYRFGCFLVLFFSILFQTYIWFEANELKTNFMKLISKIVYRRSEFISVWKVFHMSIK